MGCRANYVIVGDDGFELFYSNAGAVPLLENLAEGPAVIRRFRSERVVGHWLDDVWCEGAALVDTANRVLLHFTWHLDGIAERARRLAEIRRAWSGWDVRWAYGGIEDVVAYLGLDRRSVRTPRESPESMSIVQEEDPRDGSCVVTVRDAGGGLRGYWLYHLFCEPLWIGPRLVDLVAPLVPVTDRGVLSSDLFDLGVHVDVARREVGFWTAATFNGTVDELAACWPGWRFEFWEDRHDEQARRCGGEFGAFPC